MQSVYPVYLLLYHQINSKKNQQVSFASLAAMAWESFASTTLNFMPDKVSSGILQRA